MTQPDLCKHAVQPEWHRKSVFHTQGGTIPSRSLLSLLVWTMLAIGSSVPALANNARQTPVVKAIQKAKPAVVNIQGNKVVADTSNSDNKVQTVNGMGTGVIIDPRGYIVTCYHVVQDVAKIEVTLADGSETRARLLNYDSATDLALIKIDMKKPLPTIEVGGSHDLLEGESVIAIGNPYGYRDTVSIGIVSGLHRNVQVNGNQEYKNLIQTNADINPGNSGGPLVNINGEMIGINVAVRMGAQGIGFAIPADDALEIIADLVAASRAIKVSFNIECRRAWEEDCPFLEVDDASLRGVGDQELQKGDRILTVGGRPVKSRLDLELALLEKKPGEQVAVEAERNGSRLNLTKSVASGSAVTASNHVRSGTNSGASGTEATWSEEIWNRVGIRVVPVDASVLTNNPDSYKGGLRVSEVKPSSQASQQGIQAGDILVGIMDWRTISVKDLKWVLSNPKYQRSASSKFYIYRNDSYYEGVLSQPARLTR